MTLLIAVEDVHADEELIASARRLAVAAEWDVRAVHVREAEWNLEAGDIADVELVDLVGDAAAMLKKLSGQADVDCVAVGLHPPDGPGLGPLAQTLLESSSAPVFLVRPGMRSLTSLQRVLVPLEGTPSTSASMLFAEEVLCQPRREIVMLNVATGSTPAEAGSMPAPRFIDQEQYEWSEWQNEFSMRFSLRTEGCHHRVSVRVGDPATVIAEEARESAVDLIILTWKGTFAGGHAHVVRRLLDTSPCPLLVVPDDWADTPRKGRQTAAINEHD